VLWNQAVHTDREATANRPDITIKSKKKRKHANCGIPEDNNITQKEAEKKLNTK
jgi:hypothetical protein